MGGCAGDECPRSCRAAGKCRPTHTTGRAAPQQWCRGRCGARAGVPSACGRGGCATWNQAAWTGGPVRPGGGRAPATARWGTCSLIPDHKTRASTAAAVSPYQGAARSRHDRPHPDKATAKRALTRLRRPVCRAAAGNVARDVLWRRADDQRRFGGRNRDCRQRRAFRPCGRDRQRHDLRRGNAVEGNVRGCHKSGAAVKYAAAREKMRCNRW